MMRRVRKTREYEWIGMDGMEEEEKRKPVVSEGEGGERREREGEEKAGIQRREREKEAPSIAPLLLLFSSLSPLFSLHREKKLPPLVYEAH